MPARSGRHFMRNTTPTPKEFYTEEEAARELGISLARLYMLIDENIFNDGSPRPDDLTFSSTEMTLLAFWHRTTRNPKVVRMPKRK